MSVIPGQIIKKYCLNANPLLEPFVERGVQRGMSYGLSIAGYDIRADRTYQVSSGGFILIGSLERFSMPNDLIAFVHDKSTWARQGLAVQNTVIEPGWCGYLTMELSNHGEKHLTIQGGDPIAQIVFHRTEEPCKEVYNGKYQNQGHGPQEARFEDGDSN